MSDVIIFTNQKGCVSVCYPAEGFTAQEIKEKDCPVESMIVDSSVLPEDHTYFNAWRLVDGVVIVDEAAAQQIAIDNLNAWAKQEYLARAADEAIGIQTGVARSVGNTADFASVIEQGRQNILAATTTEAMTAAIVDAEEKAKIAPLGKI